MFELQYNSTYLCRLKNHIILKMKSNNSSLTGILLLVLLWMSYIYITTPDAAVIEAEQLAQQELIAEQNRLDSLENLKKETAQIALDSISQNSSLTDSQKDSLKSITVQKQLGGKYGVFATAAKGTDGTTILENEKLKIYFSKKGGIISKVEVKGFLQYNRSTPNDPYDKEQLVLMNNEKDRFQYFLPINGTSKGSISTADLYFEPSLNGNVLSLRAYSVDRTQYIEQKYTLEEDGYLLDYQLTLEGINDLLTQGQKVALDWVSFPSKIEKNPDYERTMTTVYYQENDDFNYCDCRTSDEEQLGSPIQWLSHSQQFFNTSLIAGEGTIMEKADIATVLTEEENVEYLKELRSYITLQSQEKQTAVYNFQFYIGPNDYDELVILENGLERIIPFGWSIFGFISRSIIRPLFNLFAMFISNYGLIVLLLTFLIRLLLFPLQYKMLLNGVKMSVLKPELEKMKEKYKDDQQGMQVAQMKMYGEYGVSPLGGCLPMMMTMPIWIALYRFFPASIAFRQKSFLWADDLVSYDSVWDFGHVPFIYNIYGDHVSLFTILWVISMFAFLWYNSKQMDMTAGNPQMKMMKYMQFAFPVLFFFALNSWAAALTAYMLFSNVLNIAQTYITKNILIDKDKLKAEMEAKRLEKQKAPKGKGGMFSKYQEMLEEQQRLQKKNKK